MGIQRAAAVAATAFALALACKFAIVATLWFAGISSGDQTGYLRSFQLQFYTEVVWLGAILLFLRVVRRDLADGAAATERFPSLAQASALALGAVVLHTAMWAFQQWVEFRRFHPATGDLLWRVLWDLLPTVLMNVGLIAFFGRMAGRPGNRSAPVERYSRFALAMFLSSAVLRGPWFYRAFRELAAWGAWNASAVEFPLRVGIMILPYVGLIAFFVALTEHQRANREGADSPVGAGE